MTDIISSGEVSEVTAQVEDMLSTTALKTSVTYIAVSAVSFAAATGTRTRTKTETVVDALVRPTTVREIEASDRYKVGDMIVSIATSDIAEPSEADKVSISSVEHGIISWMKDSLGARYRLVVRKI